MTINKKTFKSPPKKYQPRGLTVLYEDHDIIVVDKVAGLLTVSNEHVKENTAFYLLTNYVRKGNSKSRNRLFIVHRLDRDTSGILVLAKNEDAKFYLQNKWSKFKKKYVAVVQGKLQEKSGIITSYLAENSAYKMYSVSNPKEGQLAKTAYKVIKESSQYSLLEIDLLTGKKNQIRVHLADKGCPVAGDKKYGTEEKGAKRLTLHAASLTILHPFTEEEMTFETKIPVYFKTLMKNS